MKTTIFSLALFCALGCSNVHDEYYERVDPVNTGGEVDKPAGYWEEIADKTTGALIDRFWKASVEKSDVIGNWYFLAGSDGSTTTPYGYWPQAHGGDIITDAYLRTGDEKYLELIDKWYQGVPIYNYYGGSTSTWRNNYIDDMEWQAIALLRMYEATGLEKYFNTARMIYDSWIITTWGEAPGNNGGILWSWDASPKTANACSNGPAVIIAAQLAKVLGNNGGDKYLDDAEMIYTWLRSSLYNPATGGVKDNMKNGVAQGVVLTYNVGTFLGGAHLLYNLTGNISYLDDAVKAADYYAAGDNILPDEGSGDNALFKGIYVRWLTRLANEPDLDSAIRTRFGNFLKKNANTAWENGVDEEELLFSANWNVSGGAVTGLNAQLSGCMLMEAMCAIEKVNE